jgi:hypothetical protein
VELENALHLVNSIIFDRTGRFLREPETTLFQGTWLGLTYEQMAESSVYSNNYLMRDVGPKLWKLLSDTLGKPVNKTNLRVVFEGVDRSTLLPPDKLPGQVDRLAKPSRSIPPSGMATPRKPVDRALFDRESLDLSKSVPSYGYTEELDTLRRWILQENCRLVGIWGLNGVGKTTLARRLMDQLHPQFELLAWQTLHPAPTLSVLTESLPDSLVSFLSTAPSDSVSALLANRQTRSWLFVLNDIESILQPEQTAGHYRAGYENYRDFFQRISEDPCNACIIVTGLEPPREFITLEGQNSKVRSMQLSGLSSEESECILAEERLVRSPEWVTLIDYYGGHPAALRTVSRIIRNLFSGSVAEFLKQQSFLFEDIDQRLEQSFDRLSGLEKEILYCLASEGKPTTLTTLQQLIRPLSVYAVELLEALDSLKQRSLLDILHSEAQANFTLQPMIRDYVVCQFIAQVRGVPATPDWQNRWTLQSTMPSLALTPSLPKTTPLSQWLQNRFDSDWEPVEMLFSPLENSPYRLRSVFHLRGEKTVKRFKRIQFGTAQPNPNHCIVLLVAINPEPDQTVNICVQVQPDREASRLPNHLKLHLLDASNTILAEIESQEQDNFIQLPFFRGTPQECFNIQLSLDTATHTEKFVI